MTTLFILNCVVNVALACVLTTRRIGVSSWQYWAIFLINGCSQLIGHLS
jgi:hypothetical protein